MAAPSKLQRPVWERAKTDARDACDAPGPAAAPGRDRGGNGSGPDVEAARELVRAREDARVDLMRARHRV